MRLCKRDSAPKHIAGAIVISINLGLCCPEGPFNNGLFRFAARE
jgi:hypothetical protein